MSEFECPKCESTEVILFEVQGVYDGALFFICRECVWAYAREFTSERLAALSLEHADRFNAQSGLLGTQVVNPACTRTVPTGSLSTLTG